MNKNRGENALADYMGNRAKQYFDKDDNKGYRENGKHEGRNRGGRGCVSLKSEKQKEKNIRTQPVRERKVFRCQA